MTAPSDKDHIEEIMHQLFSPNEPGAALLVMKGDYTIIEKGYGLSDMDLLTPVTPATHFRMGSVSKQFTAMAILLLLAGGEITLQDPIVKYLFPLPPAFQSITVEQLLIHTSGLPDYEALIPATQTEQVNNDDVFRLVQKEDRVYFTPGSCFKYSNTGYCLLALIVEKISGKQFPEYIYDFIFSPLGMLSSMAYQEDKIIPDRAYGYHKENREWMFADQDVTSATLGDGGVYTSLRDYSLWIDGLLNQSLISARLTNSMLSSHIMVKDGIRYGYGWFIGKEEDDSTSWFHSGETSGFRNIVYMNPKKKLRIVLFTNRDDDTIATAFHKITAIMQVKLTFSSGSPSLFHWLSKVYNG